MPISRFRPKLCSIEAFSGEQHKLNISTSSRRYVVDVFTVQFQLEWGTTHSQTGQLRSRISLSSKNLLRKHRPHGRVRLLIDSVKCQSGVMRTTRIQGRGRNERHVWECIALPTKKYMCSVQCCIVRILMRNNKKSGKLWYYIIH